MSTGNDDQQWAAEVPERVPFFDPAGMYKAEIKFRITQIGRTEPKDPAQSEGEREYKPFASPIECYNGDANYETLPVDGAQIVAIAMMKAQQDMQAAGMIVRTPIESDPKYEAMVGMLNRPSITPEQMAAIKANLAK